MTTRPAVETVPSVCPHDCTSTCALEVERLDARTIGRVRGSMRNNRWYQDDKLAVLSSKVVGTYAPDLASDLMSDLYRFADAARLENDRRARVAAGEPEPMLVPPMEKSVASD